MGHVAVTSSQKTSALNRFRPGLAPLAIDEDDKYRYQVPPFVQPFAMSQPPQAPQSPTGRKESMSVSDLSDTDGTWATDGTLHYNGGQRAAARQEKHQQAPLQPRQQQSQQLQPQQLQQQWEDQPHEQLEQHPSPSPPQSQTNNFPMSHYQYQQEQQQQLHQQQYQQSAEWQQEELAPLPAYQRRQAADDEGNAELRSWSRTKPLPPPDHASQPEPMTLPPRPPQSQSQSQSAGASGSNKSGGPPLDSSASGASGALVRVGSQTSLGGASVSVSSVNSSGERHLAVWNRFFANAFSAAEGGAGHDSRPAGRSSAERSRAASAARSQWPPRHSDEEFVSLMSVARKVARRRERRKAAGESYDEEQVSLQLDRAMIAAVLRGDLAAAEQLLILGANPGSQTADWPGERTPCHFAVRYVDESLAGVKGRGDAEGEGEGDAMDHQAVKCLALLSDYGADIEAEDAAGRRPLHVAAAHGCVEALRFLLESAADVAAVDNTGNTAVQLGTCHRVVSALYY
jgi:hypothetical protein